MSRNTAIFYLTLILILFPVSGFMAWLNDNAAFWLVVPILLVAELAFILKRR